MLEKIFCKHNWNILGLHKFWQDLTHGYGSSIEDKYDLKCSKCGRTITVPESKVMRFTKEF